MFNRKFLLSLLFAIVVLCLSGPSATVQAKEVGSIFADAAPEDDQPKGSARQERVLQTGDKGSKDKDDKDDDEDGGGGFDIFAFFIEVILPIILQLLGIGDQGAADGGRV